MDVREVVVEPVSTLDEGRYRRLMQAHHYLGALSKIGETLWYAARWRGEWVALIGFSAPALKCRARDAWIGWDFRVRHGRLHLLANNSRFLILPGWHRPNLASRVLSLCERRLVSDWPQRFRPCAAAAGDLRRPVPLPGHDLPRVELALPGANARFPARARRLQRHRHGPETRLRPSPEHALPEFFADIDDPRRRQGRRHSLPTVLGIAAGATLCGMRGYKAMAEWAQDLSPRARERFRCRRLAVPSQSRHPRRTGARRSRPARPRPAALEPRPRRRRRGARHRRQDPAQRRPRGPGRALPNPYPQRRRPRIANHAHPKKVGRLPLGAGEESKRTNEIGTVLPMLDALESGLAGKTFTADALLTQTKLAECLVQRGAHYLFAVKGNRPNLLADIQLHFQNRGEPDFREHVQLRHGRVECRTIWATAALNDYLNFPHVGQAFLVERAVTVKSTGKRSVEHAYGITSHAPDTADAERLLALNRGHWTAEAVHHILDTAWDEDRCRIRTGYGPENTSRLRRFAIGLIRAKSKCVAPTVRKLNRNPRLVFDYLKMTANTLNHSKPATSSARTN